MSVKAKADIATLEQAMEMYRLDNFRYPSGGEGLNALASPAPGSQSGQYRPGGYVKSIPSDPWGRPYQLSVPGRAGPFDIYSLGADGAPGGEGENADIYSGKA
jgi:general secretion pathway protein G